MEVVKKNIGILVFLIAISTQFAYSQKGMEAGLWLGGAHYFGDLNNLYRINEPGLAGGATVRYNFNHRLSVRGQLNLARIRAHDTKFLFQYNRVCTSYGDQFFSLQTRL